MIKKKEKTKGTKKTHAFEGVFDLIFGQMLIDWVWDGPHCENRNDLVKRKVDGPIVARVGRDNTPFKLS